MTWKWCVTFAGGGFVCLLVSCESPNTVVTEPREGRWEVVREPDASLYYHDVMFVNQLEGWIVGDSGTVLHTSNGGTRWERQTTGLVQSLSCVYFVDSKAGWVAGKGATVLHTTDGGRNWGTQNTGIDSSRTFLSMSFTDRQTGWIASNYGEIIHTTDAGTTWPAQQSGTSWAVTSIQFINETHGWAVATNRIALTTSDGGTHWNSQELSFFPAGVFSHVHFVDAQRGWIATISVSSTREERALLLRTNNGGWSWFIEAVVPVSGFWMIDFVDPVAGWAVGWSRDSSGVFHTKDGGRTWVSQHQVTNDFLIALDFSDPSHGWALGFLGTIVRYVR